MTAPAPATSSARRPVGRLLLGLVPPLFTFWFIATYGVNARYWDDWWFSELFIRYAGGTITAADLFAQYNESRSAVPRLVMLALGRLTHGDVRAQLWFTYAVCCFASGALYVLGRPLIPDRRRRLGLWAVANVLIFSPVQHQNWLWPVQIVTVFPLFWLLFSALVLPRIGNINLRFTAAVLVCIIATFSHANGLILWPLTLLLLLSTPAPSFTRRHVFLVSAYLLLAAATAAAYFHGYVHPPHNPGFGPAVRDPLATAHFFFTFLGAPLAWGFPYKPAELPLAATIGLVQFVLAVAAVVAIVRRHRTPAALAPFAPWLALLIYVLLTAALTAAGRVGFGVPSAMITRYTTYTAYLPVALVFLLAAAFPTVRPRYFCIGAAAVIAFTLCTLPPSLTVAREYRLHHLQGKAALHYAAVLPGEPVPGHKLLPDNPDLRRYADGLDRADFLRPRLARTTEITPAPAGLPAGTLESVRITPAGLTATGWAVLPRRREPAHAVVLAWRDAAGVDHAVAVTADFTNRPDVASSLSDDRYLASGWTVTIDPASVPKDARAITAYAADAHTAATFPLTGEFPVTSPSP